MTALTQLAVAVEGLHLESKPVAIHLQKLGMSDNRSPDIGWRQMAYIDLYANRGLTFLKLILNRRHRGLFHELNH